MTAAAPVTLLWTEIEIGQRLGLTDTEPRQRAVLAAVSRMDWQDLGSAVLPFAPGVAAREVVRHVRQSTSRRVDRVGVGQLDGGDRGCLTVVDVQNSAGGRYRALDLGAEVVFVLTVAPGTADSGQRAS